LFNEDELPILALKLKGDKAEFENRMLTLPEEKMDCFHSKYNFVFIQLHGKEKEEELISQFLTEYSDESFPSQ
jgi:hypothetical protein